MSIRPTVEFEGKDWFVLVEHEELRAVDDATCVMRFMDLNEFQFEVLYQALQERQEELEEALQLLLLDYQYDAEPEGFREKHLQWNVQGGKVHPDTNNKQEV